MTIEQHRRRRTASFDGDRFGTHLWRGSASNGGEALFALPEGERT